MILYKILILIHKTNNRLNVRPVLDIDFSIIQTLPYISTKSLVRNIHLLHIVYHLQE